MALFSDTLTQDAEKNKIIDGYRGSSGADSILSLGGDDQVLAGGGNDALDGGPGNDSLRGEKGDDSLDGGDGDDTFTAGVGRTCVRTARATVAVNEPLCLCELPRVS